MIIRKIKPDEVKRCEELFSISFEFPYTKKESPMEIYENLIKNTTSRQDTNCLEHWAAFEDDDTTMMSNFSAITYPLQFDGHHLNMSAIGGVATLPPYRRSGGIRKCFEAALKDMYEKGISFSYLYPFSTAYYRKFGYELCCHKMNYQILLSGLSNYSPTGTLTLMAPHNYDKEGISTIYTHWQEKYNMMIINEDFEYSWIKKVNPYETQEFTYIYKSAHHVPKAYVTFKKVDEPTGRNLRCSRFIYTDLEGLEGLLSLFQSLASDHKYLFFDLPKDQLLYGILPEWSMGIIHRTLLPFGMARVINVAEVLSLATYKGMGLCYIQIEDSFIQENNQTFCVTFEDNKALSVIKSTEPAHICLQISDFSRLIIGTMSIKDYLFYQPNTSITDIALLEQIFYPKPTYIMEYF